MKNILIIVLVALTLSAAGTAKASSRGLCYLHTVAAGQYFTGTLGRSSRTSCPFARNVFRGSVGFVVHQGGQGDGDFYIRVYSPVTYRWYRTHCFANGDIYANGTHVDCRAGVGARVVFWAHIN